MNSFDCSGKEGRSPKGGYDPRSDRLEVLVRDGEELTPDGLRALREGAGLTQNEMALELEMSERQYQRLEAGDTPIGRRTVLALTVILGVEGGVQ